VSASNVYRHSFRIALLLRGCGGPSNCTPPFCWTCCEIFSGVPTCTSKCSCSRCNYSVSRTTDALRAIASGTTPSCLPMRSDTSPINFGRPKRPPVKTGAPLVAPKCTLVDQQSFTIRARSLYPRRDASGAQDGNAPSVPGRTCGNPRTETSLPACGMSARPPISASFKDEQMNRQQLVHSRSSVTEE
jgi:hypothetical protein